MGVMRAVRPGTSADLSLLLRQAAREHLGLAEGDYWPSDVAAAQANALLNSPLIARMVADAEQRGADRILTVWAEADGIDLARIKADAEQRGREDNADHGQCYVHGSRALEARLAEAKAEALREAAEEADDIEGGIKLTDPAGKVTWLYPVALVQGWLTERADRIGGESDG